MTALPEKGFALWLNNNYCNNNKKTCQKCDFIAFKLVYKKAFYRRSSQTSYGPHGKTRTRKQSGCIGITRFRKSRWFDRVVIYIVNKPWRFLPLLTILYRGLKRFIVRFLVVSKITATVFEFFPTSATRVKTGWWPTFPDFFIKAAELLSTEWKFDSEMTIYILQSHDTCNDMKNAI